jgi:hypothetical protein
MAIRSINNELNEECAVSMIKSIYPRLYKGLNITPKDSKDDANEVKEECLEILADIFKRFGSLLLKNSSLVNKEELMKIIPE